MDKYWDERIEALDDELETYRNPIAPMGLVELEISVTPFSDMIGETLTYIPTPRCRFTTDPIGSPTG